MFLVFVFLFLYLCSFALCLEINVFLIDLTLYSQSGNKINYVLLKLAYRKSVTQDPKVGPGTQDPWVGP